MRHEDRRTRLSVRVLSMALALLLMGSLTIPALLLPAVAEDEKPLTNIALGQSISATSSYIPPEGFFHEAYLVDGEWLTIEGANLKLGWNSSVTNGAGEYDPVDITLSLDALYTVSRLVVKPMKWANGAQTPRDFELQSSTDGEHWKTLVTAKDVDTSAADNTSVVPLVWNIDPTDMRYYRVHITRHAAKDPTGAYYSSIGELELYGYETNPGEEGDLTVNKYALRMNPGETDWLYLTGGTRPSTHTATYESSDPTIVTVDTDGTVHAVALGEAKITVQDTETGTTYEVPVTVDDFRVSDHFQIVAFIPFFYAENINETTFDNLKKGGITNVELNFALDQNTITYENNLRTIQLAYERGLDVTVSESDFNASSWPAKSDAQVLEFVKRYSHLPGVVGYYVVDEPTNAVPFARAIALIKSVMPNAVAHMNFCGAYDGIVTALQNELVSKYNVSLDYVMYDAYTFRTAVCSETTLYSQLEYNRVIGQRLGVPTACYIQSMDWNGCNRPDANAIRYQVFASLAAGVKQISYFCWQTPRANAYETYGPAIVDINGNPTDLFEPVSKINAAVQALGPTLMKLECRALYAVGNNFGAGYNELPAGFFLHPADWEQNLAVSYMVENGTGRAYSMLVNRDYTNSADVTFTVDEGIKTLYRISSETGKAEALTPVDGKYTITLEAGEGALLACDEAYHFEMKEVTNFYYLEKGIAAAEAIDLTKYREDGKDAFTDALKAAKETLANTAATQNDVNTALRNLQRAQSSLRLYAAEGVNIAAGKRVTGANSYEDGTYFSLNYLTDGLNVPLTDSTHAGWSIDPYSNITRDTPIDLTLDLERSYMVNTVVIRPCIYNDGASTPTDFEIQVSADGKTFTTVHKAEGLTMEEPIDQYYTIDPVEARYIRIHITKHSTTSDSGTGCALSQLGEIEVYGSEMGSETETETEDTESEVVTETESATETTAAPATDTESGLSTDTETEAVTVTTETDAPSPSGTATDTTGSTETDTGCASLVGGLAGVLALVALAGAAIGVRRRD